MEQFNYPVLKNNEQLKQKRVEGVSNLRHPDILSPHFCWAIVGTPGSGKTSYIQELIANPDLYNGAFDYIIIISPSPIQIKGVDEACITQQLKIDWLYERINYIKSLGVSEKNILIIFDDCVSQIKALQNDKMLQDLFFNRRHIIPNCTISLLITTQQYTMFPLKFRGVTDHFTFLSLSPKDFDFLRKELIYASNRKCLAQIAEIFQEAHQFIYIRLQPFLLCQNFRPLIRGQQYIAVSESFDSVSDAQQSKPKQQLQARAEQNQQLVQFHQPTQQQQHKLFSFKDQ